MSFMTNNSLIDHVSIEKLLQITTLTPNTPVIKSKVLKLFGYINIYVSKVCLEGMIERKRNRVRQRKRWRDNKVPPVL